MPKGTIGFAEPEEDTLDAYKDCMIGIEIGSGGRQHQYWQTIYPVDERWQYFKASFEVYDGKAEILEIHYLEFDVEWAEKVGMEPRDIQARKADGLAYARSLH